MAIRKTPTSVFRFPAPTTLTVSSSAITVFQEYHKVDTTSAQSIDTINGGVIGQPLLLQRTGANNLTIADAGTNVQTSGGRTLSTNEDVIFLFFDGSSWREISFGDNS